ncbi:MAG: alpha/beta hydrolase [Planctomycetota bacterium]|nr:alpha/beta hydrolase [Planctomycetota bacterium]
MIQKLDKGALASKDEVRGLLAPAPALDPALLRSEQVKLPGALGALKVLRPAAAPYVNVDPQAPAVVLVPGLGTDGMAWLRQLPLGALADLHAPQHPHLPAPGEAGLGHFARYVEAYVEARKLHERPGGVVLMGMSMGGAVCLNVASRGRIPIRGLALLGTFGHRRHLSWFDRNFARYLVRVLPPPLVRWAATFAVRRTKLFAKFEGDEGQFMVHGINVASRGYLVRAVSAITTQEQLEAARALKVPTFVAHGRSDFVLPHAAAEELARTIPGAKLVSVDGGGHAFFFTHHETVNESLARWLAELA